MFFVLIILLNGFLFYFFVIWKCIYYFYKIKFVVVSLDKINFCECEDCYVILGLIIYMFCIERVSIVFIVFVIIILYGISYFLYIVEWGFVFIRFINFYGIFVC